jgi:glyoxylate reductase
MSGGKAKVFVTRRLPGPVEARMSMLFDATFNKPDIQLDAEGLLKGAQDVDVLVSSINDPLDASTIARLAERMKLIAQFGNGVDNIDVDAAYAAGKTVTNTPSVLTEDTADMAMALIVAVPRRLVEGARLLLRDGAWEGWSPTWMLGRRLGGKALGIVGMGRIGTAVARRAKAFGLDIHYHSRERRPPAVEDPLEATYWHSLDDMLENVDIVSLHTPHTRSTFQILGRERMSRMREGAFLVNLSRPELVDEEALIELIEQNHLSGAGLDVFEHRSGINPRLVQLAKDNKVVLTAHMGSATLEARVEMGETVIVNIRTLLDGHKPPHRVLPERAITAGHSRRAAKA